MKPFQKKFDLRKNYPILFELGLIGALLISIAAFKLQAPVSFSSSPETVEHNEPPIVLSPITIQKKNTPPPALARIPAAVPNDEPIDAPVIDFADFDEAGSLMPLPPKSNDAGEPEVLEQAEFMPEMKGGLPALYGDIKYPEAAKRSGIEGVVVAQFVVNESGKIEELEIIRGIGGGCDQEVIRALKQQSFTPGIQNGRFVKVRMKQVVHFRLEN